MILSMILLEAADDDNESERSTYLELIINATDNYSNDRDISLGTEKKLSL